MHRAVHPPAPLASHPAAPDMRRTNDWRGYPRHLHLHLFVCGKPAAHAHRRAPPAPHGLHRAADGMPTRMPPARLRPAACTACTSTRCFWFAEEVCINHGLSRPLVLCKLAAFWFVAQGYFTQPPPAVAFSVLRSGIECISLLLAVHRYGNLYCYGHWCLPTRFCVLLGKQDASSISTASCQLASTQSSDQHCTYR
jgi:hypothetical protein